MYTSRDRSHRGGKIADPARTLCGILPRDPGTGVGGPVIDQQQFPVGVSLTYHAVDRLSQETTGIEKWDDYRDQAADRTIAGSHEAFCAFTPTITS